MADLFSTLASIVASYLPATMFFLGCGVALMGTGALVLALLDGAITNLALYGRAYADFLRFLQWRARAPDKGIDPSAVYGAAKRLYMRARWVANNLSPDEQTALWMDLRDALHLPEGTATSLGLGAPQEKGHSYQPWVRHSDVGDSHRSMHELDGDPAVRLSRGGLPCEL